MNTEERGLLRMEVLGYLATRHPNQFSAAMISRNIRSRRRLDFEFTEKDVESACEFLRSDDGLVEKKRLPFEGKTEYYGATADGIRMAEQYGVA